MFHFTMSSIIDTFSKSISYRSRVRITSNVTICSCFLVFPIIFLFFLLFSSMTKDFRLKTNEWSRTHEALNIQVNNLFFSDFLESITIISFIYSLKRKYSLEVNKKHLSSVKKSLKKLVHIHLNVCKLLWWLI